MVQAPGRSRVAGAPYSLTMSTLNRGCDKTEPVSRMSPPPGPIGLVGCHDKVAMACKDLKILDRYIAWWKRGNPARIESYYYPEAKARAWFFYTDPLPVKVGTLIGVIVHNLRSALDHLIWQLVLWNGETPKAGSGGNQFPIVDDGRDGMWRASTPKYLRGVRVDHRAFIEGLQPYREQDASRRAGHPLRLLANLSNIDKHQTLAPVANGLAQGGQSNIRFGIEPSQGEILDVWVDRRATFQNSTVIAAVDIRPFTEDPDVEMRAEILRKVYFVEPTLVTANIGGRQALRVLSHIGESVEAILLSCEPVFERGDPPLDLQLAYRGDRPIHDPLFSFMRDMVESIVGEIPDDAWPFGMG